ncbi:TPA: hypothetical protein R8G79_000944 [Citrobacter amalonaticus]|nr:hypothetical protein [Citrobacter amalonaticus]
MNKLTKTRFTKEQLIEQAKGCRMLAQCAVDARPDDVAAAKNLALAEVVLASLTAKPVAWTDEQELRDVEESGIGYLFTINPATPYANPHRIIELYTAPPAPAPAELLNIDVSLQKDLIEAIEALLDMQVRMVKQTNHGASCFDADTISAMNYAPIQAKQALERARLHK